MDHKLELAKDCKQALRSLRLAILQESGFYEQWAYVSIHEAWGHEWER